MTIAADKNGAPPGLKYKVLFGAESRPPTPTVPSGERRDKIKFIVFILTLFLIWHLGRFFHIDTGAIGNVLRKIPILYSGIAFVMLYVIITFFIWFSKDVLRLMAAVLFGAALSTLFIWLAETINAFILFYLARNLGRGFLEESLKGPRKNLDTRISQLNFFWLFLFRAAPLIPFRFLDLAGGLSSIPFRRYLAAVVFGSLLRIFWLQYILSCVGKSILDNPSVVVEYLVSNKNMLLFSLTYLILVVLVAVKLRSKD